MTPAEDLRAAATLAMAESYRLSALAQCTDQQAMHTHAARELLLLARRLRERAIDEEILT